MLRVAAMLVQLTAVLVFLQLVTGGFLLIADLAGDPHWVMGLVTIGVALIAVIVVWVSKPRYNALRYSSVVTLLLLILVGFTSEKTTILEHYEVAVVLFGVAVATTFYAVRWSRMPTSASSSDQGSTKAQDVR